jgi:hypothetical protein
MRNLRCRRIYHLTFYRHYMELKRVVVTGIGALTPLETILKNIGMDLINGVSGANMITFLMHLNLKPNLPVNLKTLTY